MTLKGHFSALNPWQGNKDIDVFLPNSARDKNLFSFYDFFPFCFRK